MDFNLTPFLSTLLFTYVLANLPSLTTSDVGECPYPCYPPPTGTGTPTVTTPPPPPSKSAGSYPPPGYASPTDQDFPFYPPPPFGNNLYGLPPPDPMLPYFPFYYRKPPHQTDASLATSSLPSSTLMMAASNILAFAFLHLVFGC
ncbi:hypothetical protein OIU77_011953 [Salix suchowensis]|uniref:Hydroxyproline-rich glycoprotein family protein n=1 Tax=Salix suchowensis TaxID=1278906 RepID=A0ABQ9A248_9ROSI|nr:hydroxyproline-rich glycoprotein [Salix suchowensis]KAG5240469.1 hydroxyproline-rich glycoprotein [Salix suchowensis]KAJ6321967.1 hypothetical protein OIU77_011953 [Salix suchowensis]KAJ6351012.1 hypothetical protein OIU78_007020 [Salix suchowensis]